ncbi:MAG TPA: hypothetical protein VHB77_12590, partial [Planctomycetaceae bacterium]|nr:hypothetical protein [Planctomycetaceae bacterium]
MINPNLSRSWLCAAWILAVAPLCVYGAPPRAALPAEQGADSVSLKGGGKLSGALLERTPEGNYRLAVRREWLKTAQPKLFAQE